MLRTTLDKAYIKRTIRPNYGWTQATPKSCFLSTEAADTVAVDIYPGFVMVLETGGDGETYKLIDHADDRPAGLAGLYAGGDGIDEVADSGVGAFAVWVLGPDAEFELYSPAFTDDVAGASPGTLLYGVTDGAHQGKVCLTGTANAGNNPVAKLISVVSPTHIIVGGLQGTV